MFSIINDYKIAGISPFLSALLPALLPATLFAPSRRLIVISHREAMEVRTRLRFAFANHSRLPYIVWAHFAQPPLSRSGAMILKSPNSIRRTNRLLSSNIRRAGKSTDPCIHRNPPRCPYRRNSRYRPSPLSPSPSSSRILSRSGTSRKTRRGFRPPRPAPSTRRTGRRAGRFAASRTPI